MYLMGEEEEEQDMQLYWHIFSYSGSYDQLLKFTYSICCVEDCRSIDQSITE